MGFVNRRTVTIEWGDCDSAGIVFYPRYFAMFDASCHALFAAALGYRKPAMIARFGIVGTPMVDTRARFLIPSSYGDDVVIESRVTQFGRASYDVEHKLYRADGALGVECWEKRVWAVADPARPGAIKGAPVPDEVRLALSGSSK
jgi:4-hydroxybenzoyl-CoA thioesterase